MEEFLKKISAKGLDNLNPTVVIAVFLMAMVLMMVMPTPSWLLDVGLAFSFASSVAIFMVVLFSERPLDFSSFPTMLLASLLLRLSLNVSSTKLIIGEGHTGTDAAGNVIEAFADFIVGGNLLLGLVVFLVIMIVNFMVITKGAGRMAEVGARFALDAMPGKQLAIDADLASGAITHEEAKKRRKIEQEETTFFGSLDGASKFVKGDAIAGLLITAMNFFVGLAMGTIYYDMPISEAMHTYSLLTVGDGLVTQIPAVVTSIGAALLMAKGGAHETADMIIFKQFTNHPPALYTVGGVMFFLALIPGLPFIPFTAGAFMLGGSAWLAQKKIKKDETVNKIKAEEAEKKEKAVAQEKTLGDCLEVDDIWIEFSKSLIGIATDKNEGVAMRVKALRKAMASELGFIMPEVRLTDNQFLPEGDYVIKIQGVKTASAHLRPGWCMVIKQEGVEITCPFEDTTEPVYGAPAAWVRDIHKDKVVGLGLPVAGVNDIIATHLTETVKQNMRELVTRQSVTRIIDEFTKVSNSDRAALNKKIIDEFIPDTVPKDLLHQVIRLLLEERISVRNIPLILEGIAEAKLYSSDPEQVTERVRRKLSLQIATSLVDAENTVPVVQIGPNWEEVFREYEIRDQSGNVVDVALPPAEITNLAAAISEKLADAGRGGRYAAVAAAGERRRLIRAVMDAKGMRHPVVAYEEMHPRVQPALMGVV
ncbi:MAG: flagellar biosynthesis protein FlhA [Pseudomonadota bacterium]